MKKIDLIKSYSNKRLIFSILSIAIFGSIAIISIFFVSSVTNKAKETINIKENEYLLHINESRYSDIPINHFELLKQEFDLVIPFVNTSNNEYDFEIIATDLSYKKIMINDLMYDFTINYSTSQDNQLPEIYVSQYIYDNYTNNQIINIDGIEFYTRGIVDLDTYTTPKEFAIVSIEDYKNYVDSSIYVSPNDVLKYIFNDYYIYSELSDFETIDKIDNIYGETLDDYIDTFDREVSTITNQFSVIMNVPIIFFIVLSIFSIFNMFVTIQLSIKERRKVINILYIIGMKNKFLWELILNEVIIISVISAFTALLLGTLISFVSLNLIGQLNFVLPNFNQIFLIVISIIVIPVLQTGFSILLLKNKTIKNLLSE